MREVPSARTGLPVGTRAALIAIAWAAFAAIHPAVGQPVMQYRYPPMTPEHRLRGITTLVDSDRDGRAEVVHVRFTIRVEPGKTWVIGMPRIVADSGESRTTMPVYGGPVGAFAERPARPWPVPTQFQATRGDSADVELEFDGESVRAGIGDTPAHVEFRVSEPVVEGVRIDGERYRVALAPLDPRRLGWLPARIRRVTPRIDGRQLALLVLLEADLTGDCPVHLHAMQRGVRSALDSTVLVRVEPGSHSYDVALPLPLEFTETRAESLQLYVALVDRPYAPEMAWYQTPPGFWRR